MNLPPSPAGLSAPVDAAATVGAAAAAVVAFFSAHAEGEPVTHADGALVEAASGGRVGGVRIVPGVV